MSLHTNNLKEHDVSDIKKRVEVETRVLKESMQRRLKRDAILRIIYPTAEGMSDGSYVKQLNDYCGSILKMYEYEYETKQGIRVESWIKDGIHSIIAQPDHAPKLSLIFFALATEQWFADNFVPQPKIMYDQQGVPQQVPGGEPKVDASKFLKYMMNCLIPLTQKYLNGEDGVTLNEYVRRAMHAWYTTGSSLSVEQQLKWMQQSS